MSNSFSNWSTEELKDWISSLKIAPNAKSCMLSNVGTYEITGVTLASCNSAEDIVDILDVKLTIAIQLWKFIEPLIENEGILLPGSTSSHPKPTKSEPETKRQQIQQQTKQQLVENKIHSLFNPGQQNSTQKDDVFQPTVMIAGKTKQLGYNVRSSITVAEFRKILWEKETGSDQSKLKKIDLAISGRTLGEQDEFKTLAEVGVTSFLTIITVYFRVSGGTQQLQGERIRRINCNGNKIKITTKADDIIGDADDDPRALMPCGHAFTAITMFTYINHCFNEDLQITEIYCPIPQCIKTYRKPWNWEEVAAVADLTSDEYIMFNNILNEHQKIKHEIKCCPHCSTNLSKPVELSQNRAHCEQCHGSDFCYNCLQKWNGGGFQICGNKNCSTYVITQALAECETYHPFNDKKDVSIPVVRACPKCLTLHRHIEACKHIICVRKDCKTEFCISCLKVREKIWKCGDPYGFCEPAPRQLLK